MSAADPRERAFARLGEVTALVGEGRLDEAAAAGRELLSLFESQPDGPSLAGFGRMLLDAALSLLGAGRDADALELAEAVVARLAVEPTPGGETVAAGARFLAAQAASGLGRMDESRRQIEALCAMGEPALAALNRIAAQLGDREASPPRHAQVAATSVTVLWRLGRAEEAAQLAGEAATSFARAGHEPLARMLRALESEIAAAS